MNARIAIQENENLIINLINDSKRMVDRFGISHREAIIRKADAYIRISKNDTERAAWEIRKEEALKRISDMETTFTVIEAHSGTDEDEIAKAKELFFSEVEKGYFVNDGDIIIKFADVNGVITATFYDENNGANLCTVEI